MRSERVWKCPQDVVSVTRNDATIKRSDNSKPDLASRGLRGRFSHEPVVADALRPPAVSLLDGRPGFDPFGCRFQRNSFEKHQHLVK